MSVGEHALHALSGALRASTASRPRLKAWLGSAFRRIENLLPEGQGIRNLLGRLEHAYTLRFARRENMLYTQFGRAPTQLAVLAGPVIDLLLAERHSDQAPLRIAVFGCSSGGEPYSIASVLRHHRPELPIHLDCFDIVPEVIARAKTARYASHEVSYTKSVDGEFATRTLDRIGDEFVVKPAIAECAEFSVGDVLDASLIDRLGQFDVVVAQNFLFHLGRDDAERAMRHLFRLMKPRSAILMDGCDLDLRTRVTAEAGLDPLSVELEQIHADSLVERGHAWPNVYWGLEPFDRRRTDSGRRYATIFLRGVGPRALA